MPAAFDADLIRTRVAPDATVTALVLEAAHCSFHAVSHAETRLLATLALGTARIGAHAVTEMPPSPRVLEDAIAVIEDAIAPLRHALPEGDLVVMTDQSAAFAKFARPGAQSPGCLLGLEDVERAFGILAAVSEGSPLASSGLPQDASFAGALLIVREVMHHLNIPQVLILT